MANGTAGQREHTMGKIQVQEGMGRVSEAYSTLIRAHKAHIARFGIFQVS